MGQGPKQELGREQLLGPTVRQAFINQQVV